MPLPPICGGIHLVDNELPSLRIKLAAVMYGEQGFGRTLNVRGNSRFFLGKTITSRPIACCVIVSIIPTPDPHGARVWPIRARCYRPRMKYLKVLTLKLVGRRRRRCRLTRNDLFLSSEF